MNNLIVPKILSDDEIIDIIEKYIDDDLYNYAVMIDGEWGCGKTHFIKEKLYEKLEEKYQEKKVIYISLYGVNSIEEISKQVLMESFLEKTGKAKNIFKKGLKIASALVPVTFDILKSKVGLELNQSELSDSCENFLSLENNILIFDDLERCNCPINEILGYINNFVEHQGLKVIIVANQKEIINKTYVENQELKYLVAASENLNFGEESNEKSKSIDMNRLKTRMENLFGQNITYEKIREKLIGLTIHYQPNLKDVILKLIEVDSIDSALQSELKDKLDFFMEYMHEKKHSNIRTLQFYLSKIKILYQEIIEIDNQSNNQFLQHIIKYSFQVCVNYKSNNYTYDRKQESDYKYKSDSYYIDCKFVDDYILTGVLDKAKMSDIMHEYTRTKSPGEEILIELWNSWYIMEESQINSYLENLLGYLDDKKIDKKNYSKLIIVLLRLENIGFSRENTGKFIKKIKNSFQNLEKNYIIEETCHVTDDISLRYNEIINELQNEIDKVYRNNLNCFFKKYILKNDKWDDNLVDYIMENREEISRRGAFLAEIDLDSLVEKIKINCSLKIDNLRYCFILLYDRNNYSGEILNREKDKLNELLTKINNLDKSQFDKIKQLQVNWFIENLENALSKCNDIRQN